MKTDKRDGPKLATLLEAKRLKGIRIPSEREENQRILTPTREQLVQDRTAVKNAHQNERSSNGNNRL